MNKRIVLVFEYFYPLQRNDAKLLTDIAKAMYEANDKNIKVICTSELKNEKELSFLVGKINRLKNIKLNEKNIFLRIIKFFILTFKLIYNLSFEVSSNDRVFSTTNPAFLFPLLVLLKKIKKFEYTLLVYDVFPENLVASDIIKTNSFLYRITKKFYNWSYSNVDRLIVIGRDMEEVLSNKTSNNVSTFLIENWCDYNEITPQNKIDNPLIKKFKLQNKIVFLFSGNFGRVQGIENLLKAASLVQSNEFALLFIGDGVMKNDILCHIENKKNKNVFYAGKFPTSEQNNFLNACDVSLISLSKLMYGLGVPSKSYYNMAASKPLIYIGEKKSEIAKVIDEHSLGWNVSPENPVALAKLFDKICNNSTELVDIGKRSREVVIKHYSKEIILNKYKKLFT